MERTWAAACPASNPFSGVLDLVWPKGRCRVQQQRFHGILRSFVQCQALDRGLWFSRPTVHGTWLAFHSCLGCRNRYGCLSLAN